MRSAAEWPPKTLYTYSRFTDRRDMAFFYFLFFILFLICLSCRPQLPLAEAECASDLVIPRAGKEGVG